MKNKICVLSNVFLVVLLACSVIGLYFQVEKNKREYERGWKESSEIRPFSGNVPDVSKNDARNIVRDIKFYSYNSNINLWGNDLTGVGEDRSTRGVDFLFVTIETETKQYEKLKIHISGGESQDTLIDMTREVGSTHSGIAYTPVILYDVNCKPVTVVAEIVGLSGSAKTETLVPGCGE